MKKYLPTGEQVKAAFAAEVRNALKRDPQTVAPINRAGEFTADQIRAALVRKLKKTVCGTTVARHLDAEFAAGSVRGYYKDVANHSTFSSRPSTLDRKILARLNKRRDDDWYSK